MDFPPDWILKEERAYRFRQIIPLSWDDYEWGEPADNVDLYLRFKQMDGELEEEEMEKARKEAERNARRS